MQNQNFRWENIAVNTWASKIPSGWMIKSVDTKNRITDDMSDDVRKEAIAMSSSMVIVNDTTHSWNPKQDFKWVNIARDTWRAHVWGGWIVKCVDTKNIHYPTGVQVSISSSMQFISDPNHEWTITKDYDISEIQ